MNRVEALEKVTRVFRDSLDDESIVLFESTTADDIEDWDSLSHIMLITEIEGVFDYKFSAEEVFGMKDVGEMLDVLTENSSISA